MQNKVLIKTIGKKNQDDFNVYFIDEELKPLNNRKSFYGKAHVMKLENDFKLLGSKCKLEILLCH